MGSIAAKILSFLAFVTIAFGLFLFSSLTSGPSGGGLGLLAFVAIIAILALGAWLIGNIFGILAIVLSRGSKDVFTGVMFILISLLHLFPIGNAVRGFIARPMIGFMELLLLVILVLFMVMYLKAGISRLRGS